MGTNTLLREYLNRLTFTTERKMKCNVNAIAYKERCLVARLWGLLFDFSLLLRLW